MKLGDLAGVSWRGKAELWLDSEGNEAHTSACTLRVETDAVLYTWEHKGRPHQGKIALDAEGAAFTDTFHAPSPMRFTAAPRTTALLDLLGSYSAGDGPSWGWRIIVSLRPAESEAPESLVLQMTNIGPWGEEMRAVRMVAQRG